MTDKPNPPAIPELAKHHAEPVPNLADPATRKELARRWGPNLIDNAERKMRELLLAAGMPTEAGYVRRIIVGPVVGTDADGKKHCGTFRGGVRGLDRLAEHRGHAIGSLVWYAAKIIEEIAEHRAAMARNNLGEIVQTTLHLGALMREAMIEVDDPGVMDLGLKQDDALKKARPAAAEQKRAEAAQEHQRWIKAAQDIWERRPRLSRSTCADMIIRDLDLSVTIQTVRKIIAPYKPKVGNGK
jgi:hypothetical protein